MLLPLAGKVTPPWWEPATRAWLLQAPAELDSSLSAAAARLLQAVLRTAPLRAELWLVQGVQELLPGFPPGLSVLLAALEVFTGEEPVPLQLLLHVLQL